MKKSTTTVFLYLLLIFNISSCTSTEKKPTKGWEQITTKTINYNMQTDVLDTKKHTLINHFGEIKIKCVQGSVNINALTLIYEDGTKQNFSNIGSISIGSNPSTAYFKVLKSSALNEIKTKMGATKGTTQAIVEFWGREARRLPTDSKKF